MISKVPKLLIFLSCAAMVAMLMYVWWSYSCNPEQMESRTNSLTSSKVDLSILMQYQRDVEARKNLLAMTPMTYGILYNVLVPEVLCTDLVRVGYVGDGGKWVCNPVRVQELPKCTVYSLGINNDPSFEEALQQLTARHCRLRSIDKDDQQPETLKKIQKENGEFMKALIADKTVAQKSQFSFKDVLGKFGDARIDFLKVDIEGTEFSIQEQMVAVPVCQLMIEIHADAPKMLEMLKFFSQHGFHLFSYEINGYHHTLCEFSFIHRDCFRDYGVDVVYGKYLS